jgi:hypothetical protein
MAYWLTVQNYRAWYTAANASMVKSGSALELLPIHSGDVVFLDRRCHRQPSLGSCVGAFTEKILPEPSEATGIWPSHVARVR